MKVSKKILNKIKRIDPGITFGYRDLNIDQKEFLAASKSMERLIEKGMIKRYSKGIFYKPEVTPFGELKPGENEVIKLYLMKKNMRVAYVTGLYLYNSMGLTTQVPKYIQIASYNKKITTNSATIQIKSARSYVEVTNNNYKLLQLLDVLKDFNNIPDLDRKSAVNLISTKLLSLSKNAVNCIIKYSLKYPPRVRAFLGSILEYLGFRNEIEKLKVNLNPLSTYEITINENILPTITNWNIK